MSACTVTYLHLVCDYPEQHPLLGEERHHDPLAGFWVLSPTTSTSDVDVVNHPPHYGSHPSGVECITITEHMGFNLGNAVKYIWRADEKGAPIEDLEKARWYVDREISKRKAARDGSST